MQAAPPEPTELAQQLDRAVTEVNGTLDELREIARGIHPAILARGGLCPALKTLARRSAVPVRLNVPVAGRLPDSVEIAAYYAVCEALANTAKHAHASVIDVQVETGDGVLDVYVHDDGAAARTLATARAWSGSRTASRPSAAASRCTARPARAPPCRSPSLSLPPDTAPALIS